MGIFLWVPIWLIGADICETICGLLYRVITKSRYKQICLIISKLFLKQYCFDVGSFRPLNLIVNSAKQDMLLIFIVLHYYCLLIQLLVHNSFIFIIDLFVFLSVFCLLFR